MNTLPNSLRFANQIECNFSASFWLKKGIRAAEARDCLDALHDAEELLAFCKMRAFEAELAILENEP